MAFSAKVITGTLPTSGTKDFTESGFGSPDAAIIVVSSANTNANPFSPSNIWSYGFWDSANNQSCVGFRAWGNRSTSATASITHDNLVVSIINNSSNVGPVVTYTCSGITDGIRIALNLGPTGLARYVTVILLKGIDAYAGAKRLSSSTSPQTLGTGSSFTPNFVLTAVSGSSTNINSGFARGAVALGAALKNGDGITQATVAYGAKHDSATEVINSIIRDDCIAVEAYDDAEDMKVTVSDMGSNEIELTLSASNPTRGMAYLALRIADGDLPFINIISTETSTGDKAYSPGVTPEVLGFLGTALTSTNSLATSAPGATTMGAADGSDQASIVQGNKDAVATSAGFVRYDGSNALNLRTDDDSAVTVASVKSLDAGGYTLTYSTADATARKVLVWGIGAGTPLDPQIDDIDTDNIIDAAQTGVEIHGQDLQQGVAARIVKGTRGIYVGNYTADETGPTFDVPPLQDLLDAGIKFGTVKVEVVK